MAVDSVFVDIGTGAYENRSLYALPTGAESGQHPTRGSPSSDACLHCAKNQCGLCDIFGGLLDLESSGQRGDLFASTLLMLFRAGLRNSSRWASSILLGGRRVGWFVRGVQFCIQNVS